MAVSKRTRFEVLRRDEYACRYCGALAPDASLTVDHVTPVALGGSDKPDNLVAACRDCNAGKASSAPEESLVAAVADEALLRATRIRQAYAVMVEALEDQGDYVYEFEAEFPNRQVPVGWKGSLIRWHDIGVPIELVLDAGNRALANVYQKNDSSWFAYMAGILWSKIADGTEAVDTRELLEGAWLTEGQISEASLEDYARGREQGSRESAKYWWHRDLSHRLLCNVIEGTYQEIADWHEDGADTLRDRLDKLAKAV